MTTPQAASSNDQQTTDWVKVWKLVQQPWVADVRPPSALSAASEGLSRGGSGLRRLTDALLSQRLSLSSQSTSADDVFEIVLDNMMLSDLGDADGAGMSPIALYTSLRLLSANFNGIKKVAVNGVTNGLSELREVQLEYNDMSVMPPFGNAKLESISMSNNKLLSVPPLVLPRLHTLEVSHNKIAHLDAGARLPALTHLDVSYNMLVTLDTFAELVHLTFLNVSHNQLTTLNGIQGMTLLEELNASHNRLRHVPTLQHSNPLRPVGKSLASLDVSFNEISSLGFFPTGALTKVKELSIARNSFHGKKAPDTPTSVSTGPSARSGHQPSDIFASTDIGDASYNDDGGPSTSSNKTNGRTNKSNRSRATEVPSSAASGASRRTSSSTAAAAGRRHSTSGGEVVDTVTFLARLVSIFPDLELLDISHNSDDLIQDVTDLKLLSKCTNLTELRIEGTLTLPKSNKKNRKAEAVAMCLPQIEVLDGEALVKASAPVVVDLHHSHGGDETSSVQTLSSRPGTATRPMSALIRPGTTSKAKSNALQASKIDKEDVADSVTKFIREAEGARETCFALLDHIAMNAAWVYGKGEEPPPAEHLISERRATSAGAIAPSTRPDVLPAGEAGDDDDSDLEDALASEGRVVVHGGSSSSVGVVKNPVAPSTRRRVDGVDGSAPGTPSSPHGKMRSYSANSPAANTASAGPQQALSRTASSHSKSSAPASLASQQPSNAMVRIRSEPTFALEQARFRQEMEKEAHERRQQLLQLTKAAPAPMPVKTLSASQLAQGTKKAAKCESGTSMSSPSQKHDGRPASSVSGGGGGARVTASTATSPAKTAAATATAVTAPPAPAAQGVPPLALALVHQAPQPEAAVSSMAGEETATPSSSAAPKESVVLPADPRRRSATPPAEEDPIATPSGVGSSRLVEEAIVKGSARQRLGSGAAQEATAAPRPGSAQKVRVGKPIGVGQLLKAKPATANGDENDGSVPALRKAVSDPREKENAEAIGAANASQPPSSDPTGPTYYSTAPKPVQLESSKPLPAGSSLNNRRRK